MEGDGGGDDVPDDDVTCIRDDCFRECKSPRSMAPGDDGADGGGTGSSIMLPLPLRLRRRTGEGGVASGVEMVDSSDDSRREDDLLFNGMAVCG